MLRADIGGSEETALDQNSRWRGPWVVPPSLAETPLTGVCAGLGRAAGRHADALGFGIVELQARQLTWMLSRLLVRLERPVAAGEMLHVTTWPAGVQRLFALREFELGSPEGSRIGAARSAWFLIDLATRRPIDPAPHVARFSLSAQALDARLDRVDQTFAAHGSRDVLVAAADIDVNGHVTFTSYLAWIERAFGQAAGGRPLVELEINYLAEVFEGQSIRVDVGPAQGGDGADLWIAHIRRSDNGDAVAKARLRGFSKRAREET